MEENLLLPKSNRTWHEITNKPKFFIASKRGFCVWHFSTWTKRGIFDTKSVNTTSWFSSCFSLTTLPSVSLLYILCIFWFKFPIVLRKNLILLTSSYPHCEFFFDSSFLSFPESTQFYWRHRTLVMSLTIQFYKLVSCNELHKIELKNYKFNWQLTNWIPETFRFRAHFWPLWKKIFVQENVTIIQFDIHQHSVMVFWTLLGTMAVHFSNSSSISGQCLNVKKSKIQLKFSKFCASSPIKTLSQETRANSEPLNKQILSNNSFRIHEIGAAEYIFTKNFLFTFSNR